MPTSNITIWVYTDDEDHPVELFNEFNLGFGSPQKAYAVEAKLVAGLRAGSLTFYSGGFVILPAARIERIVVSGS